MDAAGEKVTVSTVRTRAAVSMDAARQGVEQWCSDSKPPEIPMPEAVQRAFATAWAAATADVAERFDADRAAAAQLVEAAEAEAVAAGNLVDTEAARADQEATRADAAEKRAANLQVQLAEHADQHEQARTAAAQDVATERTATTGAREALAEVRGRLAVLEEQAAKYWEKREAKPVKKTGK